MKIMKKNVDPRVRIVAEMRQRFDELRAVCDWMYGITAGGGARNCKLASQITAMAVTEIAAAYGVRRVLAALCFNKAKRRGLAALHALARSRQADKT
jgi:hypothetical protein